MTRRLPTADEAAGVFPSLQGHNNPPPDVVVPGPRVAPPPPRKVRRRVRDSDYENMVQLLKERSRAGLSPKSRVIYQHQQHHIGADLNAVRRAAETDKAEPDMERVGRIPMSVVSYFCARYNVPIGAPDFLARFMHAAKNDERLAACLTNPRRTFYNGRGNLPREGGT